jgi:CheY-like chemotaxis protein
MPEMDGFTLVAAIKADSALTTTRLIVLTSIGHALRSAELKQLGIEAYLVKMVKNPVCLIASSVRPAAERRPKKPRTA